MRQICPHVYAFSRGSIFQYVLVEDGRLTLIDTGLPIFGRLLLRDLKKFFPGYQMQSILITHADGDHYGAANLIKDAFHSRIAASAPEAQAMRSGTMSRELATRSAAVRLLIKIVYPLYDARPTPVEDILQPGSTLDILGGLHILDSAGHTPGHLSFYLPESRVLFAGDSIVERNRIPSPSYGMYCWSEPLAEKAYNLQMSLAPVHLCCGHSYFNLPV